MTSIISFGDVFGFEGKEYVFLAKTQDILYAAQILDASNSTEINRQYEKRVFQNKELVERNLIYCFVILQTAQYKNRLAHFARTQNDDFLNLVDKLNVSLCKEDLIEIKDKILSGPLPLELKEMVKSIDIQT